MTPYYRSFAPIDLNAIRENFDRLSALLPKGTKKICVVKADAYGHGAIPVAKALSDRADYLAVACTDEALALRTGGITLPILILSYTDPSEFPLLVEQNVTATLYREEDAVALSREAARQGKTALFHLKVDTGMGRVGFAPTKESAKAAGRMARLPHLVMEGVFSHMAKADEADKSSAKKQIALFDAFLALLAEEKLSVPLRHLCNSAGVIEGLPPYDACRFGIALYGLTPSDEVTLPEGVKPALQLKSHVIHVKTVPAGTGIGYGQIWQAEKESRIATVSIGYADGVRRDLTGKGSVLIRGRRFPIVGKVCMDQLMVDVSDAEDVSVGDVVTLIGKDGSEAISAEEYASLCHSFNYEAVCAVLPRVKRLY